MADPFATTGPNAPSQAQGSGALGMPASFWENLMNFGAATSIAANARDANGFLTYGNGWGAPLGAGMLSAEQQSTQNQQNQATLQGQNLQNQILAATLPYQQAKTAGAIRAYNRISADPDASTDALGASSPMPSPTSAALGNDISTVESGNNPGAVNSQGYAGAYQFGTAALNAAGLYQPAKGEDLTKNQWAGTITVPGFQPMTAAQFLQNPQAQTAAWTQNQQYLTQQIPSLGMDKYIGQTIGGVPINSATLIAMMQVGGPTGAQKFLQTGGAYNPTDANGTSLSAYALQVGRSLVGAASSPQASSMIPQGMLTPAQAAQKADQLTQIAQSYAMLGLDGTPYANEANTLRSYAYGALKPADIRSGGTYLNPATGQIIRGSTPITLYGPGNVPQPGIQYGGVSQNGVPISQGSVESLQIGGQQGAPSASGSGTPAPSPVVSLAGYRAPPPAPYPLSAGPSPITEDLIKKKTDDLSAQQDELDKQSEGAANANAIIQQMRNESQGWKADNFANIAQDLRTKALSLADLWGVKPTDPAYQAMSQVTGNQAAFVKNATQLTMQAVRTLGSRVAFQEFQQVKAAMPSPTLGGNAVPQILDEMGGMNDFLIAKDKYASTFMGSLVSLPPGDQYKALLTGFNVPFNQNITPTAFIINRMTQTPDGQQQVLGLFSNLAKTPEGRAEAARLKKQILWGQQNGLFDASPAGGP